MNEITLMIPTLEYADDIWKFRQEVIESNDKDKFAGCGNLEECKSPQEWIDTVRRASDIAICPPDRVPSDIYIAVRNKDRKIVGVIELRHHINNPILETWGGHTGYYVRPTERKKGYASEMLRQNIINAKQLGIDRLLITCDADNAGSEKVILKNGGIFEKEIIAEGRPIKRYWITV